MKTTQIVSTLMMVAGLCCGTPLQTHAEDFYKGQKITIYVGYSAGGGYDAYARLLARHIGRHIPGNPSMIVVNMPGAGSVTALQYLDVNAPKDGTAIDTFDYAQIGNSRLTPDKIKIDFRKFSWIGSIAQDLGVCYVWHTVDAKTIADLKRHGRVHMGATNVGTAAEIQQRIFKTIFKIDLKSVSGYAGSAEEKLAIERGELDGGCGSWSSVPADWISGSKIYPLLRLNPATAPDLPANVPYAGDIAPNARDHEIIRLLTSSSDLGKPYVASAAVPAERAKILRDGFAAAVADPQFLAEAATQRLPVSAKTADDALKIVGEIYSMPDDIVAEAKEIVGQ
jgi:tripartite-type tricarboxylate transporter receptor subunit TctC